MSPQTAPPGQAPEDIRQWVHIDDFTPGLFDNSFISLAEPKLAAPIGAGDAINSWCCAALAAGLGLGPLPALTTVGTWPSAMPGSSTEAFVIGFAVNPDGPATGDELILVFSADDGTNRFQEIWSDCPQANTLNQILDLVTGTFVGIFGSPYPSWTRMTPDGTGSPQPVLVIPLSDDTTDPTGHLYVYPELLAPTVYGVQDLIVGNDSFTGQVICYGSRVLVLVADVYPHPTGTDLSTNENINFTDPPLSAEYGSQGDVIAAESPWGYGAWGTISVGELMLIKKVGGGLIIYGDIDAVQSAIPMPGVQDVGDFVGKAAPGPLGLVYCSEQQGAWIWNGGNTSQKISQQLRDSFYDATTPTGMAGNNYGFAVAHWQNWILFSNNYMYDVDTGSWWQIYPPDGGGSSAVPGHTMWWWIQGRFGNTMYSAPLRFGTAAGLNKNWWYKFDSKVPAPHYQWQSLPIHVSKNADRRVDVREVILRLSDPSSTGTATVTVTIAGNAQTTTTVITNEPQSFVFNFGAQGLQDIVIQINADNAGGSAPIVHSIDIGYSERQGDAPQN